MEFARQEYWSGLPFPSPGDLPDPGIELESHELWTDSLLTEPPGKITMMNRMSKTAVSFEEVIYFFPPGILAEKHSKLYLCLWPNLLGLKFYKI